jgi:hypothetical protein
VAAEELLRRSIEAHGGLSRYESASELTVRMRVTGWAFVMRFQRGAFADITGTVSTAEPRTVLSPYPGPGRCGVLERNRVRIESDSGVTLAERAEPRKAIRSFRRNFWWDDLDLLYFGGYALWGYMAAPFVFQRPGYEIEETDPWREDGEVWDGLRVRFPEGVPAHSREQTYYIDRQGLIRRNDYTAEAFGSWAKATHYCWDHRDFSGLVVPTRRKAMPRRRNGKPVRAIGLVSIAIDDVKPG